MLSQILRSALILITFSGVLAACGPGQGGAPTAGDGPDLTVALFDRDHVIDVEVEIDPTEWNILCQDGRTAPSVFSGCSDGFAYQNFRATVTVDGERYRNVAIRKKGFLGSLSNLRPSLKLNFGTFVEGRTHAGMKRMTLNNNRQDPSNTHQCMAYELFRQAGSIAPRCNFARVVVNGEDLGIYTHVESVKKPMIRRHFSDDNGNLYEGQGSDVSGELVDRMQLKTNEELNDRSDLRGLAAALEVDDDLLLDALEEHLDIDAFMTFWAMEVITSHWDSYSGNRNNYLMYHDPSSDQFYFIPWGADGAFQRIRLFNPENTDIAVLAEGAVANRLYEHPEGRAMYVDRLRALYEQLWDEDVLLAEADRIGALTNASSSSLEQQRRFIVAQGEGLRVALAREVAAFPEWIRAARGIGAPQCRVEAITRISGEFETVWLNGPSPSPGSSVSVVLNGEQQQWQSLLVAAGLSTQGDGYQLFMLRPGPDGQFFAIALEIPREVFVEGVTEMHGLETSVFLALVNPATPDQPQIVGFGGVGTIRLDQASTEIGGPVSGSFESEFIQIGAF